jgi:hypothetical protein
MTVITSDTISNIQGMLDRATLTQAQAKADLESGKFDEAQFTMVVTEMAKVALTCQLLLTSITITSLTSLIPDDKAKQAENISKAFQAISKLG